MPASATMATRRREAEHRVDAPKVDAASEAPPRVVGNAKPRRTMSATAALTRAAEARVDVPQTDQPAAVYTSIRKLSSRCAASPSTTKQTRRGPLTVNAEQSARERRARVEPARQDVRPGGAVSVARMSVHREANKGDGRQFIRGPW